jgi:anti-sigma regulatory factor (Ser/Thr protein kinase)
MKELSLHILDVAKNSVKAGASLIEISVRTDANGIMTVKIIDNGCGMSDEILERVTDPFYTTRTTRKVGLGLPLFRMAAEQTGGGLEIRSSTETGNSGTEVTVTFDTKSIDCMPMGDIISTVCILVAGSPEKDFVFTDENEIEQRNVALDTRELRAVLGDDVSLAEPEIQMWMSEYLKEQYENQTEI